MHNQNTCTRRDQYYQNGPTREFRTRARKKKKNDMWISDSLFDAITCHAGKQNLSVTRPNEPLLPDGPHIIINSKRCRVSITEPIFPGRLKDGRRGIVVKKSLADTHFHLFVYPLEGEVRKIYVMPNSEVLRVLPESRDRKGLKFPYLSGPDTAHKQYLEAWHLLA